MDDQRISLPRLPTAYSATLLRSDGISTRVYCDEGKRRVEQYTNGNCNSIVVYRPDQQLHYLLNPSKMEYTVVRLPEDSQSIDFDPESDFHWAIANPEEVNGVSCDQYEGRITKQSPLARVVLVDPASGLRLMTRTYNKLGALVMTVNCTEITVGAPPATVFEPPQNYKQAASLQR